MDIGKIRQDFSVLINQPELIYFDNACMALRPAPVIEAIQKYYKEFPVCAGRSAYKLADKLTRDIEDVRVQVAKLIGAKYNEIIFTKNTTEAINLVANSLDLKEGDIVLGTDKEHNSNLTPWLKLAQEKGIIYKVVPSRKDNTFDLEKFEELLREGVKLAAMGMSSNLDGVTIPIHEIIKIAHENGALVLLDAAQAVPHQEVNVSRLDIDFLAFSGHKMCGPSGTGVLYGKNLENLDLFMVGGGTIKNSTYSDFETLDVPEKFEAGLQNYAGILGLGAAVKYLQEVGLENIAAHELKLNKIITGGIKDILGLKILGPENPESRGGIVSFYIEGVDSHEIAVLLDKENIAARSGQFCVHSWFNKNNIQGALRASFYFYNTMDEAERFVVTLKKIVKLY